MLGYRREKVKKLKTEKKVLALDSYPGRANEDLSTFHSAKYLLTFGTCSH